MTEKRKKSFVLHIDSLDILDDLEDQQVANLFRAIKDFQNEKEPVLDAMTKLVFLPFKNQFIRDNGKYEETRKRRAEAGSKGGKAKVANASKGKQMLANQANLADSDSKSVSESDSDNVSNSVSDKGIKLSKDNSCPHKDIVDLYHSLLPSLSKIKTWTSKRQSYLRTVWNEDPKRQDMDYWEKYFNYVKQSDFLMGKSSDFKADLEWLVKPGNFIKVIEGKYENK